MLRKNLIVLVAFAAAVALALAACGGSDSGSPAAGGGPVTIELVGGQPEGGPTTITVRKGDTVHLTVESDQEGEVHVHGYDLENTAGPGQPAVFDFTANIDGIFDVESHIADVKIAKLVVNP